MVETQPEWALTIMKNVRRGRYDTMLPLVDKRDDATGRFLCRQCNAIVIGDIPYCCGEHKHRWLLKNSWAYIRQYVLIRDRQQCKYCESVAVDVHHIKQVCTHPELEFELENLVSVCEKHHRHNPKERRRINDEILLRGSGKKISVRISNKAYKAITKAKGRLTEMKGENVGYSETIIEICNDWLKSHPNGK